MENTVTCQSLFGDKVEVPRDKIIERTCAYAFVLHGRSILFLETKSTGRDWLPGGGIEGEESLREALHREVREETGVKIRIIRLIHRREERIWHERRQEAYHQWSNFYACIALTDELIADDGTAPEREKTNKPHWVCIDDVDLDQLQPTLRAFFPSVRDELLQLIEEGA